MRRLALLRAVNLGSQRRVPMPRLRELAEGLGLGRPQTHLNSGNLLVDFDGPSAELEVRLQDGLRAQFGFEVAVLVRTAAELERAVSGNPLAVDSEQESRLLVCFCSGPPSLAGLDAAAIAPERVAVGEGLLYVWTPEGVRSSAALRALSDRRSGVLSTARNLRVVRRLAELAAAG